MRRVLFVDDEVNILEGLERGLRRHRKQWEMEFLSSGAEALRRLEEERGEEDDALHVRGGPVRGRGL